MGNPSQNLFPSACILLIVLLSGPLRAGESSAIEEEIDRAAADAPRLDEMVVTPARRPETLFETPYSASLVPQESLSGPLAPRALPDAFRDVPGVMVQRTAYGQGSPYIRGLTGFRTLALLDGIRLNNSTFRDGPNQYVATVDNLSLRGLEVVRGPGAVLYGSDAMGGTMNFLPRVPVRTEDGYEWGGRVHQRLATAERSSTSRLEAQGGAEDFGILLGGGYAHFGDLTAGDGKLDDTGYDQWNLDARIEWRASDALSMSLGYQHVDQDDVPRTHRTIHARPWHGTTVGSELERNLDQTRDLVLLRADLDAPAGFVDSMSATLSWQRQDEERHRSRTRGRTDRQGVTVDTFGFQIEAASSTDIGLLTYGMDLYHDDVSSFRKDYVDGVLVSTASQGPVADDSSYDLFGLFLQDEVEIVTDLALTAGVRGVYARADADDVLDPETGEALSIDDDWTDVIGSLRLAYGGIDGVLLYGGVSQGFRAPNLSDLTRLDTARSNEIETPAPGLDPERTLTFEIGGKVEAGPVKGSLSLYHTELSDFIQRVPTGREIDGDQEVTKDNIGDGYVRGFELALDVDLGDGFRVFGSAAYVSGKVDTYPTSDRVVSREYLDRLPPMTGMIGASYLSESGHLAMARLRMADKADRLSTRDEGDTQRIPPGGTPGYAVLDLTWSLPLPDFGTITFVLENLLDKDYRIHGSGQNEPGRNFIVTLELFF